MIINKFNGHIMEHNGDIKKVLYLIEHEFNGYDEINDDSVKPIHAEENYDMCHDLKELIEKINSYDITDGSKEFREGVLYGLQLSSIMLENLINKLEEKNERY